MTPVPQPTKEQLETARNVGAATYANAWIRLMAMELGVPITSQQQVQEAAKLFVEPLNEAMGVGWGIFVQDRKFALARLDTLRQIAEAIPDDG